MNGYYVGYIGYLGAYWLFYRGSYLGSYPTRQPALDRVGWLKELD